MFYPSDNFISLLNVVFIVSLFNQKYVGLHLTFVIELLDEFFNYFFVGIEHLFWQWFQSSDDWFYCILCVFLSLVQLQNPLKSLVDLMLLQGLTIYLKEKIENFDFPGFEVVRNWETVELLKRVDTFGQLVFPIHIFSLKIVELNFCFVILLFSRLVHVFVSSIIIVFVFLIFSIVFVFVVAHSIF